MPAINPERSVLLVVDFQSRLMPAIEDGATVIANARRMIDGAELFRIPILFTEQNTKGLGGRLPELHARTAAIAHKMTFDACHAPDFMEALGDRTDIVATGCEAHDCVLQTVLGLLKTGRRVFAVRDAVGSRRPGSKEMALRRMERNGAEIVTTEMVLFEWLRTADDRRLQNISTLVK